MRTDFVERRGRIEDLDRSFDLQFWQAQPAQARFDATWELVLHACKVKGIDVRQLRLQRDIEVYGQQRTTCTEVQGLAGVAYDYCGVVVRPNRSLGGTVSAIESPCSIWPDSLQKQS